MSSATEIPTTGTIRLPPAPRSVDALGRNHTIEAALAELVDNSIDAGARHVLVRFVRESDKLVRLLVVDDGAGMDDDGINVAMTIGGDREYGSQEIGRFGLGLKSASFSQACTVTVVSRCSYRKPVGRQWRLEHARKDFECAIVAQDFAHQELEQEWELPPSATGTVIRWDEVKGFPRSASSDEVERFIHGAFSRVRLHFGLIFHRLLESCRVRVYLDVADVQEGMLQRVEVAALSPFGYPRTGAAGWPKVLSAEEESYPFHLECHVWPGRSNLEQFRLDGDLIARQGIYVYYQDRLVQRGGWNALLHGDKQLNLARVALDVDGDVPGILALKPEKNGIEVGPDFEPLVRRARSSDQSSFAEYIDLARGVLKESNRRRRVRSPVLPPGAGFAPEVKRALETELPWKEGEDPIEVRWTALEYDQFFEVDRETRTLWLNKRHRESILGGQRGSLNDAPLVKALMFLLTENIFSGQNLGPRDKDNLEVWQSVLTAAARAEHL